MSTAEEELENLTVIYEPENFQFTRNATTSQVSGWYRALPKLPQDCRFLQIRIAVRSLTRNLPFFIKPQYVRLENLFCKDFFIEYTPPIMVYFTLPPEYPTGGAVPIISLKCTWLPPERLEAFTEVLTTYLTSRGNEEPCLWDCFDFLETHFFSSLMQLPRNEEGNCLYNIEEAIAVRRVREEMLAMMVGYDYVEQRRRFDESMVECAICADEEKLGRECTRLQACGHVACHECFRMALEAHLADGVVAGVLRCLECPALLELNEVKEFATPKQFETYDSYLLQRSLNEMEDVVKCPRRGCSASCVAENRDLAVCAHCQHAFCPRCLRLTHPGQDCQIQSEEQNDDAEEGLHGRVFIRYELKDVSVPREDVSKYTWKVAHEKDTAIRRELIEKVLAIKKSTLPESLVSRAFKKINFHRCPNCGLFVDVSELTIAYIFCKNS